ncbi:helix-turn-helix domain-containing protein [Candidatus Poribacteria bacterium]|nr:helix-turn-helix domain-containing protein [Candidatus Poribacteria bacterium]
MDNNQIVNDEYFTVKQTASFLNVTEQTVSKYLRDGILKGEKKGPKKKWHIKGEEIIKKRKEWGYN